MSFFIKQFGREGREGGKLTLGQYRIDTHRQTDMKLYRGCTNWQTNRGMKRPKTW